MRLLHFLCRRWKPILPPPLTVAPYALTGTAIRLNFKNPSQLGRHGIAEASFPEPIAGRESINKRRNRKRDTGYCGHVARGLQTKRVAFAVLAGCSYWPVCAGPAGILRTIVLAPDRNVARNFWLDRRAHFRF